MSRRALLLGSASYEHLGPLAAPTHDLPVLSAALGDPALGAFDSVHVCLDLPQRPFAMTLESWLKDAGGDDTILVYLAGHGQAYGRDKYLLYSIDSEPSAPFATSVSAHLLQDLLDRCRASGQIVILDTCDAAAGAERIISGRRPSLPKSNHDVRLALGPPRSEHVVRYVLYASSLDNDAWEVRARESERSYSLLVSCLLFGLRNRLYTPAPNGRITMAALRPFIEYAMQQFVDTSVGNPLLQAPRAGSIMRADSLDPPYIALDGDYRPNAELRTLFDEPEYAGLAEALTKGSGVWSPEVAAKSSADFAREAPRTYLESMTSTIELDTKFTAPAASPGPTAGDLASVIRSNGGRVRRGQLLGWLVEEFRLSDQAALALADSATRSGEIYEAGPYYAV